MDKHDIDTYSLDEGESDVGYSPKTQVKNASEYDISEAIDDLMSTDHGNVVLTTVLGGKGDGWDSQSQTAVIQDENLRAALVEDVEKGIYAKCSPIMARLKLLNPTAQDLPLYIEARKHVVGTNKGNSQQGNVTHNTQTGQSGNVQDSNTNINSVRRAAGISSTGSSNVSNNAGNTNTIQYDKMSELDDDAFLKEFEKAKKLGQL